MSKPDPRPKRGGGRATDRPSTLGSPGRLTIASDAPMLARGAPHPVVVQVAALAASSGPPGSAGAAPHAILPAAELALDVLERCSGSVRDQDWARCLVDLCTAAASTLDRLDGAVEKEAVAAVLTCVSRVAGARVASLTAPQLQSVLSFSAVALSGAVSLLRSAHNPIRADYVQLVGHALFAVHTLLSEHCDKCTETLWQRITDSLLLLLLTPLDDGDSPVRPQGSVLALSLNVLSTALAKGAPALRDAKPRVFRAVFRALARECGVLSSGLDDSEGAALPAVRVQWHGGCGPARPAILSAALALLRPMLTDCAAVYAARVEDMLALLHVVVWPTAVRKTVAPTPPPPLPPAAPTAAPPPASPSSTPGRLLRPAELVPPDRWLQRQFGVEAPPSRSRRGSDAGSAAFGGARAQARANALLAAAAVVRAHGKTAHARWPNFLPELHSTAPRPVTPSLFTLLLHDPSPKVKEAAADAIAAFLDAIPADRLVPITAPRSPSHGRMAGHHRTLGERVADMLQQCHTGFECAVRDPAVFQGAVMTRVLRACAALLRACPYDRLESCRAEAGTLIGAAVTGVAGPDVPSQTAALFCVGAACGSVSLAPTLRRMAGDVLGRLLSVVAAAADTNVAVLSDALLVTAKACVALPVPFQDMWDAFRPPIARCATDGRDSVRVAALKVVETVLGLDWPDGGDAAVAGALPLLTAAVRDGTAGVRACAWDCLSLTPPDAALAAVGARSPFASSQAFADCLAVLRSACCDANPAVRASASRVWGAFGVHRAVKMPEFVIPAVTDLCVLLRDSAPSVRAKATWAVGMLASNNSTWMGRQGVEEPEDAPAASSAQGAVFVVGGARWGDTWHRQEASDTFLLRMLPGPTLRTLCDTLLLSLHDSDKVASTAVRALARCVSALFIHGTAVGDARLPVTLVHAITQCTESPHVKLRWNACYALAGVLPWTCSDVPSAAVTPTVELWGLACFRGLIACLYHDNFKVRIAASHALQAVWHRRSFGSHFEEVVQGLVSGLVSVDTSVSTLPEYHYEEVLKSSLTLALCNCLHLGTDDDYTAPSLRALFIDNSAVVEGVLAFADLYVDGGGGSGLRTVRRVLSFVS